MGETRRSARLLDPYVLVTAATLLVALATSVTVKTPALLPSAETLRVAETDGGAAGTSGSRPAAGRIVFAPYAGEGPFDPRGQSVWALVFGAADDAGSSRPSSGCGATATGQAPAGSSSRQSG